MYERFSDGARKVLQLANQQAQRFNHEYIGTEHILLGLVKYYRAGGLETFPFTTVSLNWVVDRISVIVQPGPDTVSIGKLPQTPLAKRAIDLAIETARVLGHNYVGPEHLIAGLRRTEGGVAETVLLEAGLKLSELFEAVRKFVGVEAPVVPPPSTAEQLLKQMQAREVTDREEAALEASLLDTRHRELDSLENFLTTCEALLASFHNCIALAREGLDRDEKDSGKD